LYKLYPTYRWALDGGDQRFMALNSPDLISKMLEFRGNKFDATKAVTADVDPLFHEAAIKANLVKMKRTHKEKAK